MYFTNREFWIGAGLVTFVHIALYVSEKVEDMYEIYKNNIKTQNVAVSKGS